MRASAENLFSPFSADLLSIYHCQPAASRPSRPTRLACSKDGEKGEMYFLHSIGSMFGFGRAKATIILFQPNAQLLVLRNASVGVTCCLLPLFDTQMCLCLPNACPYFGQCLLPLSVFLSASLAHPFVPNGAVTFRFLRGLPVALLARARAERCGMGSGNKSTKCVPSRSP